MNRQLLVALAAACLLTSRAQADDYSESLKTANRQAESGDLAAATRTLSTAHSRYPQDTELTLRLALSELRQGLLQPAASHYALAQRLNPESTLAVRGEAIARARLGECDQAENLLATIESERSLTGAERGEVERCRARVSPTVTASLGVLSFGDHPVKQHAVSAFAQLELPWGSSRFALAYRGTLLSTRENTISSFGQDEAYLSLGLQEDALQLRFDGAIVRDGSGSLGTSAHGEVTAKWLGPVGLSLRLTGSRYDDGLVLRAHPELTVPLWSDAATDGWLALTVGASAGWALEEWQLSGNGALSGGIGRFGLTVGGSYGRNTRTAQLENRVIYATWEPREYGAFARATYRVDPRLTVFASYSFDAMGAVGVTSTGQTSTGATTDTNIQAATIGIGWSF